MNWWWSRLHRDPSTTPLLRHTSQGLKVLGEEVFATEYYEGCGARAAHAAESLVELFSGGGQTEVDAASQAGHVDADLECGRGDEGANCVGTEAVLDARLPSKRWPAP